MNVVEAYRAQRAGIAVYGGTEPQAHRVARTYRARRELGEPASEALDRARDGRYLALYPHGVGNIGAPVGDGLRWVERPGDAGLRFVGFADELTGARHTGWYADSTEGASGYLYRGAVYQLPAHRGRARYVSAYASSLNEGPAAIAFGEIFIGEPGFSEADADHYCAHRDASRWADRIAEIEAEKARDWDEAWQAGAKWRDLGDEVAATRRDALELLR